MATGTIKSGVISKKTTLTSNSSGQAQIPNITTTDQLLLYAYANGILTIPFDGGTGDWWVKFINPSNLQPYPNLERSVTYIYVNK